MRRAKQTVAALNARAVLKQVKHGRLPPFWSTYRWRRRRDLARLVLSAVAFCLVSLLALVAVQRIVVTDPATLSAFAQTMPGAPTAVIALVMCVSVAAAAGVLISFAVSVQALVSLLLPASQRPVLVLLPEGCVERTGALIHRIRVVPYAEIGRIELHVRKIRPVASSSTTGLPLATPRTSIRLILHYWNGKRRSWTLRSEFGTPALLAQAVIAAHGQYSNTMSARRPRVSPAHTRAR